MTPRQLEYVKCWKDKTRKYFIENYLTTFNAVDGKEEAFKLFPRQIKFIDSLVNHQNTIAIKPRQAGITTVSSAWITGQLLFSDKTAPETVLCIGNKLDISQQLIDKIGKFLDQIPRWMWGDEFYSPDPDSDKNKRTIYKSRNKQFIELFNGCKIYARSSGENAARGISAVSILLFDEAAFIQNGTTVYAQAVAATASVKKAKIIMVSTPNGKDQLYYRTYQNALEKKNNFYIVDFKWFQDPRYNRNLFWYKKNDETGEIQTDVDTVIDNYGNIEYNEKRWDNFVKQGWHPSSPWYETMCKTFNNDTQKIAQELDVSFMGSSDNVLPSEVIEMHKKENVIEITDDWVLQDTLVKETWIWRDPIPFHRYIISVDPSTGSGMDSTAIEIIDVDAVDEDGLPLFEQVLEYNGKLNGSEVGQLVNRYGTIYNNALAVVECIGGYGDAVVLALMELNYPNLYYDNPKLKNYISQNSKAFFYKNQQEQLPGFRTSALRSQMSANFVELLKTNEFKVRSIRVINQLETWVFKNGRPDHMDGCHDDLITCLAMGLFVLQYYMLQTDKQKKLDAAIVGSWSINNSIRHNLEHKNSQKNIEISEINSKYTFPFYSNNNTNEKRKLNAMLMLGGFNTKGAKK